MVCKMTDKKRQDFIKVLKSYKNEVTKSKKASKEFLVSLGIVTEKGSVTKKYKNICIQEKRD